MKAMLKSEVHRSPEQDSKRIAELEHTLAVVTEEKNQLTRELQQANENAHSPNFPTRPASNIAIHEFATKSVRVQPKDQHNVKRVGGGFQTQKKSDS